jgi:hypothetical protein
MEILNSVNISFDCNIHGRGRFKCKSELIHQQNVNLGKDEQYAARADFQNTLQMLLATVKLLSFVHCLKVSLQPCYV